MKYTKIEKHIFLIPSVKGASYKVEKRIKNKLYCKYFKTLEEAREYKSKLNKVPNKFDVTKTDLARKIIKIDKEYKSRELLEQTHDELKKLLHKLEQRRMKE